MQASPGALQCVLEQDALSLLSTGSTQEEGLLVRASPGALCCVLEQDTLFAA